LLSKCPVRAMAGFMRAVGEVEEPDEMVGDRQNTGGDERDGRERNDGPGRREILQIDNMADD